MTLPPGHTHDGHGRGHEYGPRLVRTYAVTGGRARPTRNTLGLLSQVRGALGGPLPVRLPETELSPEQERVLRLCSGGALTLAEVASSLRLPVSVTKVVVSDLVDSGHVTARNPELLVHGPDSGSVRPSAPVPGSPPLPAPASSPRSTYGQRSQSGLLERVLDGLQKL